MAAGGLLKNRFKRLYKLELNKCCKVVEKIWWENKQWSWEWNWRTELRGRVEEQLCALLSRFQDFSPSQDWHDIWLWTPATECSMYADFQGLLQPTSSTLTVAEHGGVTWFRGR